MPGRRSRLEFGFGGRPNFTQHAGLSLAWGVGVRWVAGFHTARRVAAGVGTLGSRGGEIHAAAAVGLPWGLQVRVVGFRRAVGRGGALGNGWSWVARACLDR